MFNVRKNRKGFTLVELIVVIAILAILAGTAAGIGVTLINKNTNKTAVSEIDLLVDDLRKFILGKENDGWSYEGGTDARTRVQALMTEFKGELEQDSKQVGKIDPEATVGDLIPAKSNINNEHVAGKHCFSYIIITTDTNFTVAFFCKVKGSIPFGDTHDTMTQGGTVITERYTYSAYLG